MPITDPFDPATLSDADLVRERDEIIVARHEFGPFDDVDVLVRWRGCDGTLVGAVIRSVPRDPTHLDVEDLRAMLADAVPVPWLDDSLEERGPG